MPRFIKQLNTFMPISQEKWNHLKKQMLQLGVQEEDLVEKFILGSGKGGQKLQKTYSCVYLRHTSTGVEVKCQKERFREDNRFFARRLLCEKIAERLGKENQAKKAAVAKLRKQKKRRSAKAKKKVHEEKMHQSLKKKLRLPPQEE